MLSRLVGTGRAADLLFSSRVMLAEEALEIGLVNRVVAADRLLAETLEYAKTMAAEISPWSLEAMKRQLYEDLLRDLQSSAKDAEGRMAESFNSSDFSEGVAALKEKRTPNFEAR